MVTNKIVIRIAQKAKENEKMGTNQ